ncbi:MAG: 4-hydroxy-4-methyl-2-oxoglutarate aldolase [bacterium]|nr:4-hydroxy-4-methyl-2-oxoglutarate aldolase [bacterium]
MALPDGWTIVTDYEKPDADLVAAFQDVETGPAGDALGRSAAMDAAIKPIVVGLKLFGTAVTVATRPCDNLACYKALDLAGPGDVLVIAVKDYPTHSVWGDLTSQIAMTKGLAGVVTDGMVRDIVGLTEVGLPVFARGLTPNSPQKDGPAQINVPIVCGGMVVHPGDIILGDSDGVVVIPRNRALEVLEKVKEIARKEAGIRESIRNRGGLPDSAIEMLKAKGLM